MRIRGSALVALLVVAVIALGGCDQSPSTSTPPVTWAQARAIHDRGRSLPVDGYVRTLWGGKGTFVATVADGPSTQALTPEHTVLVDRRGTKVVPGRPRDIHVSADGHYAGWVDLDGPRTPRGRLPQIVVTDLRTQRVVLRDHSHLGRRPVAPDSLWDDGFVRFLGFDAHAAYWTTPGGPGGTSRTWGARIGTWRPVPAPRSPRTTDSGLGQPVLLRNGRVVTAAASVSEHGVASPDGRWCVGISTDRPTISRCRTGARATPRYPKGQVSFGGWLDADTYLVLARTGSDDTIDPAVSDHSTGVLASCSPVTRRCRVVQHVRHTDTVVLPTGESIP